MALKQGVPQGSVLAPLLFLLFINPIVKLLPATNAMFVDDLSVWITDTSLEAAERRLQEAVNAVVEWSITNMMKLNVSNVLLKLLCRIEVETIDYHREQADAFQREPEILGSSP